VWPCASMETGHLARKGLVRRGRVEELRESQLARKGKIAPVLPITVQTERGARQVRPAADELGGLVRGLGGRDGKFLVVQRVPDLPDVYIQVLREADGEYVLEHRAGGPGRHFRVRLSSAEAVVAAMAGWAAGSPGWDDGLAWRSLDFPVPDPPAPLELAEAERGQLEAQVRLAVAAGYRTRADLAELAEEYLATQERRPVSRPQAEALADRLWTERVREQEHWEGETDPERLTTAFTLLEEAGIVARENFACCRPCGLAEIGAEARPESRGFVFFHDQCTERAAAGQGLSLYYGGFDGTEDSTAAVGREVVTALEQAGLPARWDGRPGTAIEVTPLDWRKRLVG
jgi:Domain of unknown function (DUF6891)